MFIVQGLNQAPSADYLFGLWKRRGLNFRRLPLTTVFDRYASNETFDYVITLCHEASTENCPVFRDSVDMVYGKQAQILGWSVLDFLELKGSPDEKLEGARKIRDTIKA